MNAFLRIYEIERILFVMNAYLRIYEIERILFVMNAYLRIYEIERILFVKLIVLAGNILQSCRPHALATDGARQMPLPEDARHSLNCFQKV